VGPLSELVGGLFLYSALHQLAKQRGVKPESLLKIGHATLFKTIPNLLATLEYGSKVSQYEWSF